VQQEQTVSEMVEEILERQAKSLANRSGRSLGDARQAVVATEAGRQLRDLANGDRRREKAMAWQVSMFWERAEQRFMHLSGLDALARFAAKRHPTRS
jgi:hypothetical protein